MTEEGRHFHRLFPHVLGMDVVFGTNNEKRPHLRGTGKSFANKNLPLINAFLPSQQQWVFDWFVNDALPNLFHPEALAKTTLIITDQDKDMIHVLDQAIKNVDGVLGTAKRRICKWHKASAKNFENFAIFEKFESSPQLIFLHYYKYRSIETTSKSALSTARKTLIMISFTGFNVGCILLLTILKPSLKRKTL